LGDGDGEAVAVQLGVLAQRGVLLDALLAVGVPTTCCCVRRWPRTSPTCGAVSSVAIFRTAVDDLGGVEPECAGALDFLRLQAITYVYVDMQQGYPCSISPVVAATADLGGPLP
jgi:hypothetical protein